VDAERLFFQGKWTFLCCENTDVLKEHHITLPDITIGSTKKTQTGSYSKKKKRPLLRKRGLSHNSSLQNIPIIQDVPEMVVFREPI
jgi:hypothetical protein